MFPFWQFANSTLIATVISGAILLFWNRRSRMNLTWDVVIPALVVGLTVLVWRSVGNVAQLNDDPVPGFSPNDLLCPVMTYTVLGCYGGLRSPADVRRWERFRGVLTLVSLIVNVLTI
jgi:hypothetical protein